MPTLSISMDIKLHEAYIAPEVWERASNASPRSDMFSWGIVFFELLTGRQPYKKIDDFIKGKQLPQNAVELLRNLPLSEKVYEILRRSCAFSVNDRYESMKEPL